MNMTLRLTTNTLTILLACFLTAQAADFAPGTFVSNEEIENALKKAPATGTFDEVIKTVDCGGYKVSVVVLRRTQAEPTALTHPKVTEVYQMIKGSGDLETGGALETQTPVDLTKQAAGPSFRGVIKGAQTRHIGPGEVAVIPPGVPHRFRKLDDTVVYLVTRIELTAH
jgi:mannose-6-phosphate isomerase-like protein (cupin superfamily)